MPVGGFVHAKGGDTSEPSHVYFFGINPFSSNAALLIIMAIPSFAMELLICKIAIKNLAILQTGDLPDPSFAWVPRLRYRPIFVPHRIGKHTARLKNCPLPCLADNLQVSPKINVYFWGKNKLAAPRAGAWIETFFIDIY